MNELYGDTLAGEPTKSESTGSSRFLDTVKKALSSRVRNQGTEQGHLSNGNQRRSLNGSNSNNNNYCLNSLGSSTMIDTTPMVSY